jgi:hypothetical protein
MLRTSSDNRTIIFMLAELCKHTILIPQPYIGLSKVILKSIPAASPIMIPTQGLDI